MKTKLVLTTLCLMFAIDALAIDLNVPKPADLAARAIVKPVATPMSQSLKLQEFLALPTDKFKRRMPEILELLQDYEFSKRSIREREVQIREYLRLAVKAINADDTAEADDYVYNAYVEFRSDFDSVIRDISLSRYPKETLTPADMVNLRCNLASMQQARREGNDIKLERCPAN